MRMMLLVSAAIAVVSAAPAWSQAKTGGQFVAMAGASDLYEKTSSQLVLASTKDAKARSFAQMMVSDHTKSTADVKAAAMRAKMKVAPPKLNPEQTKMVADLRGLNGVARDQAYVMQQKTAHNEALALHSGYASDGTVEPLKQVAAKTAPVVQHHIDMLKSM